MIAQGFSRVIGLGPLSGLSVFALIGIVVWELWKTNTDIRVVRTDSAEDKDNDERFLELNQKVATLLVETRDASRRIAQLQDSILELENTYGAQPISNAPLGAFINEAAKATKESAKKAMLKQIIDDNVALRKKIKLRLVSGGSKQ